MGRLLLLFVLVLIIGSYRSMGMYEDQVGMFDWRQHFLGRINSVQVEHGSGIKRLIVTTAQNVLAALNMRTGEIMWRQIMEEEQQLNGWFHHQSYIVIVSGNGQRVRCFNSLSGSLLWETSLSDDECSNCELQGTVIKAHYDSLDKIFILTGGIMYTLIIDSGDIISQTKLPNTDIILYSYLHVGVDEVKAVGIAPGSHVQTVTVDSLLSTATVPAAWISHKSDCILIKNGHLLCLDSQSGMLHVFKMDNPIAFQTLLSQDFTTGLMPTGIEATSNANQVLLRISSSHIVLLAVQNGSASLVKNFINTCALDLQEFNGKDAIWALDCDSNAIHLTIYDIKTLSKLDTHILDHLPKHNGLPTNLDVALFTRGDGSVVSRLLIRSQDYSLSIFLQSGSEVWKREEALASILVTEMVDLPVSHLQAKMEEEFREQSGNLWVMFSRRLLAQYLQLQEFLIESVQRFLHQHSSMQRESDVVDDEDYLIRDDFNQHKLVIVVTSARKLYGIDSYTGRIIWQHYMPLLAPFSRDGLNSFLLFVQRTTAHFHLPPQMMLLGKHSLTGHSLCYVFNPITGQALDNSEGIQMSFSLQQAMLMPQADENFLRPVIILDERLNFHVFPHSATHLVTELAPITFMYVTDINRGLMLGYGIQVDSTGGQLKGILQWTVDLGGDGQRITNVLAKRSIEHVHSQGVVLGDRSVMYKYLNPNLVAVTTERDDSVERSVLTVYLLDGVTGQLVFHCTHRRVRGPVHLVHAENWLVYSYWNWKARRQEVSVLELYEGNKQTNATSFSSLHPPAPPLVERQTYIFSTRISSLAATITEKGITSRHLLMALNTGGILELPKMFIDARRPIVPLPIHQEEGLIPYMPELPRPFEAHLNYNQSVYRIRHIHTTPTGLESTCLMLAYGLDLYFTRVSPSKKFDVLKEDFDYIFISSVLLGMIIISLVSQKLAARKTVSRAWK